MDQENQNQNQNQTQNQNNGQEFFESYDGNPRIVFLPGNKIALEVPAEVTAEEQDRVDFATGVFEALRESMGCGSDTRRIWTPRGGRA